LALRAVLEFCAGLADRAAVAEACFAAWTGFGFVADFAAAEDFEVDFSEAAPDWAKADAGPSTQLTNKQLNAANALRKTDEFPREICKQ
jgi:hypothetical protein